MTLRINRELIDRCLDDLDWQYCQLADAVGIPRETLSRWLSSQMPTVEHLRNLTKTLNDALSEKGLRAGIEMEELLLEV